MPQEIILMLELSGAPTVDALFVQLECDAVALERFIEAGAPIKDLVSAGDLLRDTNELLERLAPHTQACAVVMIQTPA